MHRIKAMLSFWHHITCALCRYRTETLTYDTLGGAGVQASSSNAAQTVCVCVCHMTGLLTSHVMSATSLPLGSGLLFVVSSAGLCTAIVSSQQDGAPLRIVP